jgi:hypothetical protein
MKFVAQKEHAISGLKHTNGASKRMSEGWSPSMWPDVSGPRSNGAVLRRHSWVVGEDEFLR